MYNLNDRGIYKHYNKRFNIWINPLWYNTTIIEYANTNCSTWFTLAEEISLVKTNVREVHRAPVICFQLPHLPGGNQPGHERTSLYS